MKKTFTFLIAIFVVGFLSQAFSQDIVTKESFGTTAFDANSAGAEGNNGIAKTYWWSTNTTFQSSMTSKNGYLSGASDTSIRVDNYVVNGNGSARTWSDTSTTNCLHLAAPTRYGGAWDTVYFYDIVITDYKNLALKFGWGKRGSQGGWPNCDSTVRGLNVEYRIDRGNWIQADTTEGLVNPLNGSIWAYAEFEMDEIGDTLDIRFSACYQNASFDNQIGIDDILVTGNYDTMPEPSATKQPISANFRVYPNPVKNELTVELNRFNQAEYSILTANGQVILKGYILDTKKTIDVTKLKSGIYFIQVTSENEKATSKFVK